MLSLIDVLRSIFDRDLDFTSAKIPISTGGVVSVLRRCDDG